MIFKKIGTFGIGTLLFLGSLHLQAAIQYKIEDLGKIPDGASKTISINDNGDYTISLQNNLGEVKAYLVSAGQVQDMGSLGNGEVAVTSLNNFQQSTGSALSNSVNNKRSAFLYSDGNMTNIENLAATYSQGQDVNNSGVSVGGLQLTDAVTNQYSYKAYVYDPQAGQMIYLDDIAPVNEIPDGSVCSYDCWNLIRANGINSQGVITGDAFAPHAADNFPTFSFGPIMGKSRAYVYDGQSLISLGTLGGDFSRGQAINDLGHVAGVSDLYHEVFSSPFDPNPVTNLPDPSRVFFYDGKNMNDRGVLDGGLGSIVEAMNNKDEIVGSVVFDGYKHAFISTRQAMIDLNSLITSSSDWTELTHATDINDNGAIVGYGLINGETHGFKLVPVEKSENACLHVSTEICEKILINTNNL